MSRKALLAVLAHPDDESFGPGGTFAKYAAAGVDVHICIATDGAAGSIAEGHHATRDNLVAIRQQELSAAVAALGATLHTLDYRDSGMRGDVANDHPEAFINCDLKVATRRVVALIRTIKPQVIVTHDETGGYFHPDHIRCWEVTTEAFHLAGDSAEYATLNLPAYQPERLYYTAFPRTWVAFFVFLLRLQRKDPTKMGRNKDIDFTRLGIPRKQIHTRIDYGDFWEQKVAASAAHASQGGQTPRAFFLPKFLQKRFLATDTYMRAYPSVPEGYRENDLFPSS